MKNPFSFQPRTDPLLQDCRLNTALIYTVLGQKVSCCVELLKNTKLPLVSKLIRIRNCNGFNALELAKQLGNREIILHLTHHLAIAEQSSLKLLKKSKLDPKYADWLMQQKYGWKADWLDWNNQPPYNQYRHMNPMFWNTSRSMESLSTKDEFDDELRAIQHEKIIGPKLAVDPVTGLVIPVKTREKALSNREEIEKVLAGHNALSRLDSLNLRKKLEEERLNRAMSMYNLPPRRYFEKPILTHWRDDESVSSSMILDYDLKNNLKQTQKQRMYAEPLKSRKTNDRYVDQLMLGDQMFYGDPYEDLWQKETYSWFKNKNAKRDSKMPNQNPNQNPTTHTHHSNSSTLPRRMSKIEHKQQEAEEQIKNPDQSIPASKPNSSGNQQPQNLKLPPIPSRSDRSLDYEAWIREQELRKS